MMSAEQRFEEQLRALVCQAFDLRDGPYLHDAVEAIVEAWHRRPLTVLELQQEQQGRVRRILRLLSESNPDFDGVEPHLLEDAAA
jgi:hypothetical protein